MATLIFYGASDDYVIFEGPINESFYIDDEDGFIGVLEDSEGRGLVIRASFDPRVPFAHNGWVISVGNTLDAPDWAVSFGERPDYEGDPAILIEVPDDVTLRVLVGTQ